MKKLFIDGSVNPKLKFGFAGYLLLDDSLSIGNINFLSEKIKVKKFTNTSSTRLELQAFLWAIEDIKPQVELTVYTDCQNLLSLLNRREKLEINNYISGNGKILSNADLYKEFYVCFDLYKIKFIKVKGHKKSSLKNDTERIFSLVDRKIRRSLKLYISS